MTKTGQATTIQQNPWRHSWRKTDCLEQVFNLIIFAFLAEYKHTRTVINIKHCALSLQKIHYNESLFSQQLLEQSLRFNYPKNMSVHLFILWLARMGVLGVQVSRVLSTIQANASYPQLT